MKILHFIIYSIKCTPLLGEYIEVENINILLENKYTFGNYHFSNLKVVSSRSKWYVPAIAGQTGHRLSFLKVVHDAVACKSTKNKEKE